MRNNNSIHGNWGSSPTEYGLPLDDSYKFDDERPEDYSYTVRGRCKCGRYFRQEKSAWSEHYDGPDRCPACLGMAYRRNVAK